MPTIMPTIPPCAELAAAYPARREHQELVRLSQGVLPYGEEGARLFTELAGGDPGSVVFRVRAGEGHDRLVRFTGSWAMPTRPWTPSPRPSPRARR